MGNHRCNHRYQLCPLSTLDGCQLIKVKAVQKKLLGHLSDTAMLYECCLDIRKGSNMLSCYSSDDITMYPVSDRICEQNPCSEIIITCSQLYDSGVYSISNHFTFSYRFHFFGQIQFCCLCYGFLFSWNVSFL
jgi:hypothetical protein